MTNRLATFSRKPKKAAPDISDLGNLWTTDESTPALPSKGATTTIPAPKGRLQEHVKTVPIESVFALHVDSDGRMHHPRGTHNPMSDEELRDSIAEHGILQPLIVRPAGDFDSRDYEIVKGSRRFYQALELGLTEVPVIVRNVTREQAVAMSYIMTAHQEQLPMRDRAQAILAIHENMSDTLLQWLKVLSLVDKKGEPKLLTPQEVERVTSRGMKVEHPNLPNWVVRCIERAGEVGRRPKVDDVTMERHVGLTRQRIHQLKKHAELDDEVLRLAAIMDEEGNASELSSGHSQALVMLRDHPDAQRELAKSIKRKGLSGASALDTARSWLNQVKSTKTYDAPSTPMQAYQGTVPDAGITVTRREAVPLPAQLAAKADPLETLQQGTALWAQAAQLIADGKVAANYRAKLLREVETMELQAKRIRKALKA